MARGGKREREKKGSRGEERRAGRKTNLKSEHFTPCLLQYVMPVDCRWDIITPSVYSVTNYSILLLATATSHKAQLQLFRDRRYSITYRFDWWSLLLQGMEQYVLWGLVVVLSNKNRRKSLVGKTR